MVTRNDAKRARARVPRGGDPVRGPPGHHGRTARGDRPRHRRRALQGVHAVLPALAGGAPPCPGGDTRPPDAAARIGRRAGPSALRGGEGLDKILRRSAACCRSARTSCDGGECEIDTSRRVESGIYTPLHHGAGRPDRHGPHRRPPWSDADPNEPPTLALRRCCPLTGMTSTLIEPGYIDLRSIECEARCIAANLRTSQDKVSSDGRAAEDQLLASPAAL